VRKYLFLLALAVASHTASAQQSDSLATTPAASRPDKIEYLNQDDEKLPSEVGAVYERQTIYRDSVRGAVRIYFLPSGKLRSYTPYANLKRHVRHGPVSHYYESGQLRLQEACVAGKLQGERVVYYPNGTLKRRDQLVPGQLATGQCFGPDGQPIPYFAYEVMPQYVGGQDALLHDVALNTHYPTEALRRGVYGIVKIQFVVDKDGKIQKVRPEPTPAGAVPAKLASAYQQLQEAAMEAVRQLKPFEPGRQDGQAVAVSYTVPVTFRIK
jgi:protein TonB